MTITALCHSLCFMAAVSIYHCELNFLCLRLHLHFEGILEKPITSEQEMYLNGGCFDLSYYFFWQ